MEEKIQSAVETCVNCGAENYNEMDADAGLTCRVCGSFIEITYKEAEVGVGASSLANRKSSVSLKNPYRHFPQKALPPEPVWNEGHAVGKVEGWNEAIEAAMAFVDIAYINRLEALREEGGG